MSELIGMWAGCQGPRRWSIWSKLLRAERFFLEHYSLNYYISIMSQIASPYKSSLKGCYSIRRTTVITHKTSSALAVYRSNAVIVSKVNKQTAHELRFVCKSKTMSVSLLVGEQVCKSNTEKWTETTWPGVYLAFVHLHRNSEALHCAGGGLLDGGLTFLEALNRLK